MSRITKNNKRINPRYFLDEIANRREGLLHEVLRPDNFGEDGNFSAQTHLSGIAASDVPGKEIKKGDFLVVSAIMRGGIPMGRYTVYNQQQALEYKTREPMPSVLGIKSYSSGRSANFVKPGKWWYSRPDSKFDQEVSNHGGEGYRISLEEMEMIGIPIDRTSMDEMSTQSDSDPTTPRRPEDYMMKESKQPTTKNLVEGLKKYCKGEE